MNESTLNKSFIISNDSIKISQDNQKILSSKLRTIVLTILFYWVISISMVFTNKYLLSSPDLKFNAPLFITWYQCLTCVFIYLCLIILRKVFDWRALDVFTKLSIDMISIFPVALIFVLMVVFNNLTLKYVSVSFYMVVRSLATIFNVVLVYLYFGEKTSPRALLCCFIITVGFFLGVQQERAFGNTMFGVICGILSSFFAPLNSVYIKKTIKQVEKNLWVLNFWVNFYATFIFLPLIFIFDEYIIVLNYRGLFDSYFWLVLTFSGILGWLVGYVTSLQIQVTSPLTHNISGTAKSYVQTLLGVIFYNEFKSLLWWMSNVMVLMGAALYSYVRNREMIEKHKQAEETKASTSANQNIV